MAKTVDTVKKERVYSNEISFIRCAKDKKEEKGITLVALVITIVLNCVRSGRKLGNIA